jgi:diadenylate cyclase
MNNLIAMIKERVAALDTVTVIQYLVICVALFLLFRFFRQRRALQVTLGLFLIYTVYLVTTVTGLSVISNALGVFAKNAEVVLLIIYAPELRVIFEYLGNFLMLFRVYQSTKQEADAVIDALKTFSRTGTGALIFIERKTRLEDMASSAIITNSNLSSELLMNIFTGAGPLHDGGVLIRRGRIYAAACKVSTTTTLKLNNAYGARHQAAVNLSASCDAIVFTVSEEDRTISIAERGTLTHLTAEELPKVVYRAMNVKGYVEKTEKKTPSMILYKGSSDSKSGKGKKR